MRLIALALRPTLCAHNCAPREPPPPAPPPTQHGASGKYSLQVGAAPALLRLTHNKHARALLQEALMSDDFTMSEDGGTKKYAKADYVAVLCDCVRAAVPDFTWGAATSGETDADGYAIATVTATGACVGVVGLHVRSRGLVKHAWGVAVWA